jgi:1,4-dihydroxy-2-naphthoyl-CoA hydrolase
MYRHKTIVRLPDADAAGILFFSNYFRFAHDAYESYMATIGFAFSRVLKEEPFLALIAHAEADYLRPLPHGEEVEVELRVVSVSNSSYTLEYVIRNRAGEAAAKLRTIHVVTDKTGKSQPIPEKLRVQFEKTMQAAQLFPAR